MAVDGAEARVVDALLRYLKRVIFQSLGSLHGCTHVDVVVELWPFFPNFAIRAGRN